MLIATTLLLTAFLFGGMVLYSFGFAAFLFTQLPADQAGTLLRKAFPHFYTWCIATSAVAAALFAASDIMATLLLGLVALTTIPARQLLMPAINRATDQGDKARFKQLHSLSVVVTLAQIGAVGYCLIRLVTA